MCFLQGGRVKYHYHHIEPGFFILLLYQPFCRKSSMSFRPDGNSNVILVNSITRSGLRCAQYPSIHTTFCFQPNMTSPDCFAATEILSGNLQVSVSYMGDDIYATTWDLCSKMTCPVQPGAVVLMYNQDLPPIAPPVRLHLSLSSITISVILPRDHHGSPFLYA